MQDTQASKSKVKEKLKHLNSSDRLKTPPVIKTDKDY